MTHENHQYQPVRFHHVIISGVVLFTLFFLAGVALGSEPPPVVGPVRRVQLDAPKSPPSAEAPRDSAPPDGPMCFAAFEEHDGATLLGVLLQEPASEGEEAEVTMQMRRCWRGETKAADPFLVLAVYRYEETLGVPAHARGALGAIWCSESAFRTVARTDGGPIRGDWLDGYSGAWGSYQLHSWSEDDPGKCRLGPGGRDDLFASAACWWSRVEARIETPFVRALKCKDPYPLAEALVSNQSKYGHLGCRARSTHWTELERWRK